MTLGVDDIARIAHEIQRQVSEFSAMPWDRLKEEHRAKVIEKVRDIIEHPNKPFGPDASERAFLATVIQLREYM